MVKIKLTFALLLSTCRLFSQEWTLVPVLTDVGTDVGVQFIESDKESNNLVLGNAARIYHMNADGVYKQYDNDDFFLSSSFPDVKILNNKITCIRQGDAVYEINPITDQVIELYNPPSSFAWHLYLEEDTTWVLLQSDLIKIDGSNNTSFGLSLDEMVKIDNRVYGYQDGPWGLGTKINGVYTGYDTSNSSILDNYILDIDENKVLSHVYVATAKGISVFNGTSFQFHYTPTLFPEMEYENVRKVLWDDKNNMLWMVLADENDVIKKISGTNGTWMHFDNSNAPFAMEDFNDMAVDSLGNIWIASDGDVHVLGLDSLKGWLGVEELETEKIDFSVYPNPSNGKITLQSSQVKESLQYEMVDLEGSMVQSGKMNSSSKTIDLPTGVYVLNVSKNKERIYTEKIIVFE